MGATGSHLPRTMSRASQLCHATCVSLNGAGVLLLGPSGSGKSDLALRLMDGYGALLVADDAVELGAEGGVPVARAPERLLGLLEVRGVGILPVPHVEAAPVRLAVRLGGGTAPERLPEPETEAVAGVAVPLILLDAFQASAPAKLRLALAAVLATGAVPGVPDRFERVAPGGAEAEVVP